MSAEYIRQKFLDTMRFIENQEDIDYALKISYPLITEKENCKSIKKCLLVIWDYTLKYAPAEFNQWWIDAFSELDRVLSMNYENRLSYANSLNFFRKLVKERFNDEIYNQFVQRTGLSLEEQQAKHDYYKQKVKEDNMNRDESNPIYLEDIEKVVKDNIKADNFFDRIVACLLASGVRTIELLKTATFSKISDNKIKVSGLAKVDRVVSNERYLLFVSYEQFIASVSYIRANVNIEGKNNTEIAYSYGGNIGEHFKKLVRDDLTPHSSRNIFGQITYLLYGKGPETQFIMDQLGHNSADSTQHYLSVVVKRKNEKSKKDECIKRGLDILKVKKITQKELRSELGCSSATVGKIWKIAREQKLI